MFEFIGYKMYRKDMYSSKQTGIIILIANHLKFWNIKYEMKSENAEVAMIKVQFNFF